VLKLITGLHHFQSKTFLSHKELFDRLVNHGQNPDALFITCSDSRINPNLITHTDPGDLFILRNAGNIVPAYAAGTGGETATIEFAVEGLGIKDIIVCGHSRCGAMHGLLHPEQLERMPQMRAWLAHTEVTRRSILENYKDLQGIEQLNVAIQENVLAQLENLRTHPCVADRLAKGQLNLHGWVYKLRTGQVFSYDPEEGQFLPLSPAQAVTEDESQELETTI